MINLLWLTEAQMVRLEPIFPKSHGKPHVDDQRGLSGIIFINRNDLRWRDTPKEYGQPKTLYDRWKPWSDKGVFARMMDRLAAEAANRSFFVTAGQVRDYTDAAALPGSLPKAGWSLTDRGYYDDWFRDALKDKGIKPCIPGRKSRGKPIKHDKNAAMNDATGSKSCSAA